MIVQLVLLLAVVIVFGAGLAWLWSAINRQSGSQAQRVTVPVDDPVRPHGR